MVPVEARPNFHFGMAHHARHRNHRRKVIISLHLVTAVTTQFGHIALLYIEFYLKLCCLISSEAWLC
jgi:hypothetical protein